MMERIHREELFMEIAKLVARRSTCERAQVGAVIVKKNRVISMGYGGSPSGQPHCTEVGCEIGSDGGCIRTVHAEANAIAFAARHGISLEGCSMYVTLAPCYTCAKLLINAGIKEVVYLKPYRKMDGVDFLLHAGMLVYQYRTEEMVGDVSVEAKLRYYTRREENYRHQEESFKAYAKAVDELRELVRELADIAWDGRPTDELYEKTEEVLKRTEGL